MASSSLLDRFMPPLLAGDRAVCRSIVQKELSCKGVANDLYTDFLWPAMDRVEKLFRGDRINAASEHMATRISRSIADQLQPHLAFKPPNGKRMIVLCAEGEPEELGAQMTADLFESRGWNVYFLGSGVPNDEVLSLIGQLRPELLLIFGTKPPGVPGVRKLIDLIRDIDVNPTMNIMCSGGVFNRADGLWKEVNADLIAKTAQEAIPIADAAEPRKPVPKPVGAPKKRRRRRRPPLLAAAEAQATK